jgi:DeoR/GlpR family transcriptional regulator of sugar metabolism
MSDICVCAAQKNGKFTLQRPNDGSNVIKAERQREILAAVNNDGVVSVTDLAGRLGISAITVRRDLIDLETQGRLTRTHGGAMISAQLDAYGRYEGGTFEDRASTHGERKRRIAQRAAQLVSDGDSLLINAGSTATEFARALAASRQNLRVVTNGLTVAVEMARNSTTNILVLGGTVDRKKMSTIMVATEARVLDDLHVPCAFLGVVGVAVPDGPVMLTPQEARMTRAFIEISTDVTLLVDSSKFQAPAMYVASPLSRITRIITDDGITTSHRRIIEKRGVELLVV